MESMVGRGFCSGYPRDVAKRLGRRAKKRFQDFFAGALNNCRVGLDKSA
jgi:hypothetical protein